MTLVVTHARLLTADGPGLGIIDDGAVVVEAGRVVWVGPTAELPAATGPRIDAGGRLVTPGLVNAHAHPIFGGERAGESADRAAGRSYLEIAAAGGGIRATVVATRAAGDDELRAGARARLARALAGGTTTMEAKTGYALTVNGELRLLRLLRGLGPPTLCPTLLGAHAVPTDRNRAAYVADCAGPMLDGAAGATVNAYCDEGAFTLDETRTILAAARARGLPVRAHAGQFADLGAAGLVASLGGCRRITSSTCRTIRRGPWRPPAPSRRSFPARASSSASPRRRWRASTPRLALGAGRRTTPARR